MPTNIFNKLKDEKRELITRVLIDEYCNKRFEDVNIANIVQSANIARGSFYQYFDDLEDAYIYTLGVVMKSVIEQNINELNINDEQIFLEQIKEIHEKRAYEIMYGQKSKTEYMLMRQVKNSPKGLELFSKNTNLIFVPNEIINESMNKEFVIIIDVVKLIIKESIYQLFLLDNFEKSIFEFNLKIDILKEGSKAVFKK